MMDGWSVVHNGDDALKMEKKEKETVLKMEKEKEK